MIETPRFTIELPLPIEKTQSCKLREMAKRKAKDLEDEVPTAMIRRSTRRKTLPDEMTATASGQTIEKPAPVEDKSLQKASKTVEPKTSTKIRSPAVKVCNSVSPLVAFAKPTSHIHMHEALSHVHPRPITSLGRPYYFLLLLVVLY
jgi:hypothetical protein